MAATTATRPLERLGLHNLTSIKAALDARRNIGTHKNPATNTDRKLIPLPQNDKATSERNGRSNKHTVWPAEFFAAVDRIDSKLSQLVAIERKQLRLMQNVAGVY